MIGGNILYFHAFISILRATLNLTQGGGTQSWRKKWAINPLILSFDWLIWCCIACSSSAWCSQRRIEAGKLNCTLREAKIFYLLFKLFTGNINVSIFCILHFFYSSYFKWTFCKRRSSLRCAKGTFSLVLNYLYYKLHHSMVHRGAFIWKEQSWRNWAKNGKSLACKTSSTGSFLFHMHDPPLSLYSDWPR